MINDNDNDYDTDYDNDNGTTNRKLQTTKKKIRYNVEVKRSNRRNGPLRGKKRKEENRKK